jgi:hypothetical protein
MSRSRRARCSVGRGCPVCGDAGANRRKRERAWARADGFDIPNTAEVKDYDGYYLRKPSTKCPR